MVRWGVLSSFVGVFAIAHYQHTTRKGRSVIQKIKKGEVSLFEATPTWANKFYLCEQQGIYPILNYHELADIDLTKPASE